MAPPRQHGGCLLGLLPHLGITMGVQTPNSRLSLNPAASVSLFLDREGVRARVAEHLAAKRRVEELGIEPNRPADCRDFAFVGIAPKRSLRYRCSFCQRNEQFVSGRIVLSSDGLLRLIGDDCWEKYLDKARYNEEAQDYRDYTTRQRFMRLRDRIYPELCTMVQRLRDAGRNSKPDFQFIERLASRLQQEAPALFARLEQARRMGGQLRVERSVRDYAAMERGGGSERFINRPEALHTVAGLDAVLESAPRFESAILGALQGLYMAKQAIETTDWDTLSNARAAKVIANIEANIHTAARIVTSLSAAIGSAYDFLSAENVAGIARWSADHDCELHLENAAIKIIGSGLRFEIEGHPSFELKRPASLTRGLLPDLTELERLLDIG